MNNALNNIEINPKEKGSIAYARARVVIDAAAGNREERRTAKQAVIDFLHGHINKEVLKNQTVQKTVYFPDGSQARY